MTVVLKGLAFGFGVQNESDMNDEGYEIHATVDERDEFWFLKRDKGSDTYTQLGSKKTVDFDGSHSLEWLRVEVEWGLDGSFTITLEDSTGTQLAQITAVDNTYTSGGIGFHASHNNGPNVSPPESHEFWVDEIKIIDSEDTSTTDVIDDFEDGDLAEYTGSDKSDYTVQSSTVYDGSYALECATPSNPDDNQIYSMSGLSRYPQAGDTFEWHGYAKDNSSALLNTFGYQDSDNHYRVYVNTRDTGFYLQKVIGGEFTTLASDTSVSPPANECGIRTIAKSDHCSRPS